MFLVTNGIASGNIKIDSSYTSSEYYIKASTNYLKNFNEDHSFLQKITILKANENLNKKTTSVNYELQLLPEGGHLIANNTNTLGIIVKGKNGKGLKINNGQILNSKGEVVSNFKTNRFGLGKTNLYLNNDTFYANFRLNNDSIVSKKLPKAHTKGVILSVFNPQTNLIQFSIKTNKNSLDYLNRKPYTLLIHNTSSYEKRSIIFNRKDTDYNLIINKNKLKKGVNIATLFNDNNIPIAERIFFNYDHDLFSEVNFSVAKKKSDSINISISKRNANIYYLSTSILPKETKSLFNRKNIISQLLLSPYIKGHIENPSYYFKNTNRKALNDLDLLLLTQGWSRYKWGNIFHNSPSERFLFEKGIDISGHINSNKKKYQSALLFSPENNLAIISKVNNNNVKFNNLFLSDSSKIYLSLYNKKGQNSFNGYIKSSIDKDFSSTSIKENFKKNEYYYDTYTHEKSINNFITKDYIALDEVTIKANKKKFRNNPSPSYGFISKSIKIDDSYEGSMDIKNFLINEGFRVASSISNNSITRIYLNKSYSISGPANSLVFFNDVKINQDLSFLNGLTIDDFNEIFISKNGRGEIYFYSTFNNRKSKNYKNKFKQYKVPLGFSIEKEYYQPKYTSLNSKLFDNFGSIYWKSKIKINKNEQIYNFKIPDLGKKTLKVIIEGITDSGSLISIEKDLIIN